MTTPYTPDRAQTQLDIQIGSNFCKCPSCGEFFSGANGFDHHRAGDHAAGTRHCVNPAEVGMKIIQSPRGTLWVDESVPDDSLLKAQATARATRAKQIAKRKAFA